MPQVSSSSWLMNSLIVVMFSILLMNILSFNFSETSSNKSFNINTFEFSLIS